MAGRGPPTFASAVQSVITFPISALRNRPLLFDTAGQLILNLQFSITKSPTRTMYEYWTLKQRLDDVRVQGVNMAAGWTAQLSSASCVLISWIMEGGWCALLTKRHFAWLHRYWLALH